MVIKFFCFINRIQYRIVGPNQRELETRDVVTFVENGSIVARSALHAKVSTSTQYSNQSYYQWRNYGGININPLPPLLPSPHLRSSKQLYGYYYDLRITTYRLVLCSVARIRTLYNTIIIIVGITGRW